MGKFVRRQEPAVEAFQFTKDIFKVSNFLKLPKWARKCMEQQTMYYVDDIKPVLRIRSRGCLYTVHETDYVVRFSNGNLLTFSKKEFERLYKPYRG